MSRKMNDALWEQITEQRGGGRFFDFLADKLMERKPEDDEEWMDIIEDCLEDPEDFAPIEQMLISKKAKKLGIKDFDKKLKARKKELMMQVLRGETEDAKALKNIKSPTQLWKDLEYLAPKPKPVEPKPKPVESKTLEKLRERDRIWEEKQKARKQRGGNQQQRRSRSRKQQQQRRSRSRRQ